MSLRLPLVFWNGPPKLTVTTCIITNTIPRVITGTRGGLCVMWKLGVKDSDSTVVSLGGHDNEQDKNIQSNTSSHDTSSNSIPNNQSHLNQNNNLDLCDINLCEPFAIMRGHETNVTAITECVYDMAHSAASISSDGSLYIWGLQDGRCLAAAPFLLRGTPTSITALPGGSHVACGGRNNEIEMVDLSTLSVVRKIEGHSAWISGLTCGSFYGQPTLLSVSQDSTLRYWRFQGKGGKRLLPGYSVDAHSTRPLAVARSDDWSAILVVSMSKWHIFSFHGYKPVFTYRAPRGNFLSGGTFINNRYVLIYTVEGTASIFKLPELPTPPAPPPESNNDRMSMFAADASHRSIPPVQSMANISGAADKSRPQSPSGYHHHHHHPRYTSYTKENRPSSPGGYQRESSFPESPASPGGHSRSSSSSSSSGMRKSFSTTALNFLGAIGVVKNHNGNQNENEHLQQSSYDQTSTMPTIPTSSARRYNDAGSARTPDTAGSSSDYNQHSPFDVAAAIEEAQSTSIIGDDSEDDTSSEDKPSEQGSASGVDESSSPLNSGEEDGSSKEEQEDQIRPELVYTIESVEHVAAWHCSGGCIVRATSEGLLTLWRLRDLETTGRSLSNQDDGEHTDLAEETDGSMDQSHQDHHDESRSFVVEKTTSERFEDGWISELKNGRRVTSSHFSVEKNSPPRLVQGFDDGTIIIHPGVTGEEPLEFRGHVKRVTCLLVTQRNGRRVLISGGADFAVKIWDMTSEGVRSPLAKFYYHSSIVSMLFVPPRSIRKRLQNCFCSIGEDRSVVLYSLKTLERLHLFGGHSSTVVAVYWRADLDYLLVRCIDGSVYVWQLSTGVLERRLSGKTAADLIERSEGPGSSRRKAARMLYVSSATHSSAHESGRQGYVEALPMPVNDNEPDIQVVMISVRRLIAYIYNDAERIQQSAHDPLARPLPPGLASVLAYLLYPVSTAPPIRTLLATLHIHPPPVTPHLGVKGTSRTFTLIVPRMSERLHPFMFSPVLSALTQIAGVSVLSALSAIDTLRVPCQQGIEYFLNVLPREMQPFEEPSFLWCSQFLKETFRDIQAAADAVMRSVITRLNREQSAALSDNITNYLLENYEDSGPRKQNLVVALGVIAATGGGTVDARVLSIVALGLVEIAERGGSHHSTAISLLGEGFRSFEPYVPDTEGLVRHLFQLSIYGLTGTSSGNLMDSISGDAAQALVNIAAVDVKLFLELLSKILGDPQHTDHNTLCAGIIVISLIVKQYPSCIMKYLADIVSTVLRVLDPHFPAVREACLKNSTMTLRSLVNRYPMVSFFQLKQKLAVGNDDGVVVLYDLRTASKWQVFEGHDGQISALAFSQTGDLLASYSHKDHTCRVWQIDGAGMFNMLGVSNKAIKKVDVPMVEQMSAMEVIDNVHLIWDSPTTVSLKPSKQSPKISFNVK
eukprot:gb/GECH01004554.1/.p1 GENE.gb/GECH01004554.1/~~gb/GECH01004554.1/.p1  ORF type:complete len:1425 (+),score=323.98 gb/GECH01004554.1/:1-4275(+)